MLGHIQTCLISCFIWVILHNGGTGGVKFKEEQDPEFLYFLELRETICKLIKAINMYAFSIPEILLNLTL